MPSEEQHEESGTTTATASTTEADAVPISAVTDPTVPRNEQHKESETTPATDATTDMAVVLLNTVREGVAIVGLEGCNDKNVEEPESTDVDQQQTISSPSLDEQCERSGTAPATSASEEQQEESNKTPAIDATTKPNVAPIDANTKDAQDVELESTGVENVEEQESTYIDEQQAVSSPALKEPQEEFNIVQTTSAAAEIAEALVTKDDAHIANPKIPSEEQHEESDTTPATTSITEADVVPINVVTENVKVVELERGSAENVEEPESAVVDKKQSVSFRALEEQCKELGMASATNIPTEIAEILPTRTYAQIGELIQPIEEWHEHSDTTPVIDAITEADDRPIGVEMEVVKAVELESSYAQNVEEPKSTNNHLVQIVLSPSVEKQQKDSDTTPVADAITEADDAPIHTVPEELKTAGLGSSNAEAVAELKGTDDNLDLTDLRTALEEQHEESDIPQATDTAAENVGIIPSRSDTSMADPTLSTEVQHEESDTSPATDTTREADAVPANVTIEDVKFVKLKSSNIEYTGRSKSVDIEQQPKVSLLALEEQLKESDTTPATSAATEIAETISTRDTAQMVDPIIPTEEQYEEPISNQVTNATAETNIDTVTEDARVVELQSNNPENVEDPESADVDQKQRASSLTLEEKHEESETAAATNAAKIIAEILPTQNDVQIPDPKDTTEEQREESNTTPTIDTTIKADDALTKDVKAVEVESGNAENAEPKSAGIEKQQTASSPVFDEQHEKTETTPASDAMIETDVPVDPVTKDVNVVELESTNAKNEEEPGDAHVDQCQKIFPPNLEELHEKSHTAPSTSATREIVKDLPTRDNVGIADPTVPTEEQHKEFETTPATDATTGIGNLVVDTVILDGQVELKSGNAENVEGPCSADIDKKQEVLGPTLEEQSEETGTDPAINAATTIANTLPTRDDQQRVDPTVSTTEQYEASTIISAPDPSTAAVVAAVNTGTDDVKMVEHENSHAENVKEPENAGIDQQQAISSAALEVQHKESVTVTATHMPTKTARTLPPTDNAQKADPTVQIEEHHEESDATQATDAPTSIAEVAKLVEPESYNPENVEQPESTDNNQQEAVSHLELEEQHEESHTSPAANAGTEIAEMLPMRNDAQIADPTVSTEELHEELNSNQVTNTMIETNIDAKPEDTQFTELQSNNSENVEATESANIEQEQSVSSLALKKKHKELETAQDTNAANEIVEIIPTGNDAQRANPTEEQEEESDTTPTTDATTEVDGISYNAVTQDVKLVEHESSNVENAEETKCPDINQQQTILSPVLEGQHETSGTIPSTNATMKTEIPINPIKEDVKVVELESSNAGNEKEPESTDIGQHKVISSPNSDEQHKESDTGLTTSATREFAKLLPTRSNVQMADPTVPTEEQHKELDRTPATDATTATDNVAIDTIIQEAWVGEFKTSNAENVEGPDTADTHKKQLVSSPTLEVQGEEPGTDPTINAATEIANTLPTRDDEHIADPTVSATEQYEEPNTIPAPSATTETDLVPVNTVTEDVKIVEHESSNTENVKEPNTDQQQAVSSRTLELQDKESVIVPATYATTKIDKALPTMGNAQKADPTVPIQNHHEESDTAPATDATTEGDDVCINAVTQVLEVLELESGNAENVEEAESADLNQEPTVSSLALEEQHEESHTSPAADAATEIAEMLPMRNDAQTVDRRVSTDRLHEESTEADTQVVELEGDNSENVEDRVRADTDQKHSVSSQALEEKHEESEAAQTANTAKETFEILPTRNDAQIEDPTLPTEEQQKESDTTPAVAATVEADDITYNAVTLDVKVVAIESSNADNAEEHKSTHINQQQAFSTLAFGKQHEESETTPTVDATTEAHIPINPVTEDIKVVELEDKANTVGEQQSTDIDQQQTVSPPALDERHEESDTAPTTSAVTKIIKTLPARGDAQTADSTVPTEEQHQEFDTTPASDAPTEADNVAIDTVEQKSKLVEVKSSNVENSEWPESADIDKKQSVLCPTLEGQGEGSQTDPATNAATEIVNTLPARDAQQIADSKVSMTEQHEESNTIPALDAATEAEDVAINAATEDIKVVELEGSKAENVKEPENAGIEQQAVSSTALELQHVESIKLPATDATTKTAETLLGVQNTELADLTIPTEEHHGESNITLTIDATTERDAMPFNAATEVQNAEVAYPTVPTEEYNGESDTTPAIDETKEEDVLAIDAVTEVIKAVELDNGNVENAEEPEIVGIKQQQTVSSLALEEQHEELLMSPAANAATEIAEILPTEDYAQKADPTVPAGPHEETDTTPATDATTGVDVLSINEMTDDVKIVELESGNVKNNERQSKDANEQRTMFSLALEGPHDELNPPMATNADTETVESKSINIAQQQTVSSRALEQNLEESDMALATNAATGIAKTPLPMDDTSATDTTVPAEAQYEELDTTPAIDGREVDVPPSSTVTEITKVWQVNRRDAENVEESAYTGQQQTVWSPALEDFEKSNKTPETNAAIKTAEPLLTRDDAQTPVPTEEQHEQSDATQATNATDIDVPAVSTITEDVKAVELQSSNAGNVEEPDSTEPNQQVVLPPASEEQQEGSDTAPAINASAEIAEILHTRDNAKPVEPTIATEQLCKESHTTVSLNATMDTDADVLAVNALTKGMEFMGLKNSNVENTGDQERVGNEKQIALSPPLDACREENEFEQHKECEASSEVSLNEVYAIAELQHNVIKGADAEINAMGIPEITDHNIPTGEKEGIAARLTKEVDHGTAKTLDSNPTKEETKAGLAHVEDIEKGSDLQHEAAKIKMKPLQPL